MVFGYHANKLVKDSAVAAIASSSSTAKKFPPNHPSAMGSGIPALREHNLKSTAENENITSKWDGWPNGIIVHDFTWKEFESTGQLMSH